MSLAAAHTEYFDDLVNLFTNGAGSIPEGLTEAPAEEITSAKANIAQTFGVSQPPSLILAGTRKMIRDKWCTLASVSGDSCTIEVVAKGGVHIDDGHGNVISFRRKLQSLPVDSSSGSDITVTMYFADASAAEDALDALPSDAAAVESALLTLPVPFQTTVSDVETSDVESDWELPFFLIGVIGGALAGAGLIICLLASLVSNSVRQSKNQENAGCCGTGCCSFNAVKAWAFGEFASCGLIAVGVFLLYSNMQGLTDIFVYLVGTVLPGLLDPTLLGISDTSQIQQVQSVASMIPADVVTSISQYEEQVKLLPFAVMGPGALCIVFLLLGALCPCHPRQGTYICTKLMNFFATVFLLLSFIFYLIFVGVSVTLKYAPPAVQVQIDEIMGMCTSIPMNMRQLVADNAVAIEKVYAIALTNAGGDPDAASQDASVVSAQAMLASAGTLYQTVDGGCNALKGIFTEFENLFVPGLTCVVSIVFALFVNNTLLRGGLLLRCRGRRRGQGRRSRDRLSATHAATHRCRGQAQGGGRLRATIELCVRALRASPRGAIGVTPLLLWKGAKGRTREMGGAGGLRETIVPSDVMIIVMARTLSVRISIVAAHSGPCVMHFACARGCCRAFSVRSIGPSFRALRDPFACVWLLPCVVAGYAMNADAMRGSGCVSGAVRSLRRTVKDGRTAVAVGGHAVPSG